MLQEPASISALIDLWPTIADFASEVGCGYEAARQMRRRNSIAPEHWVHVIAASEKRHIAGVTYEWLARQRAPEDEVQRLSRLTREELLRDRGVL